VTRWIALPLVALFALTMSGFVRDLERTTEQSAALAAASEEAPRTTGEAARQVESLPQLARLTEQQATAFRALSDALEVSAERVIDFNDSVRTQSSNLGTLLESMERLGDPLGCVDETLVRLLRASGATPEVVESIGGKMVLITAAQNKAIRHLKSINRKLTALGLAAGATGVEPPSSPPDAPAPELDFDPGAVEC
jgi:hypothetical protein